MIKEDKIYEEFKKQRAKQLDLHGRTPTVIDELVDQTVFKETWATVKSEPRSKDKALMRALPLPTGSGKSTTMWALIASFAKHDPSFSCAYLVHTATIAEDVQKGIESLLGEGTTLLWTTYHDTNSNEVDALQALGHVPKRRVSKAEVANGKIVILTHRQLRLSSLTGHDIGVLTCQGAPRSLVVADEYPDLVHQVNAKAKRILALHDLIMMKAPAHRWLPILSNLVGKMSASVRTMGQTYCVPELLTADEKACLQAGHGLALWDFTDAHASKDRRQAELAYIEDSIRFVECCGEGRVFMSRQDKSFHSYELALSQKYSAFLLLDATCKLQSMVPLSPFVDCASVDELDYENLQVYYIDWPKELRDSKTVVANPVLTRRYASLLRRFVLANSVEGDEVLVISHKRILEGQDWDSLTDPNCPADWEGRKVNTQHWGAGVGSNRFNHKTHVFQFGEYHMPRASLIAQAHAWSQLPLTDESLKSAQGVRSAGGLCVPKGMYGEVHEGTLLSATKQLAMRGSARTVSSDGKCGSMKLFVTMELARLVPSLEKVFPGTPHPIEAAYPVGDEPLHPKGHEGLIYLMAGLRGKVDVSAKTIEEMTGIPSSKLSRAFAACSPVLSALGWSIVSAKERGYAGKGLYLFNEANYMRLILEKEKSLTLD